MRLVELSLDRVAGPVHLVGHSYGGVVALAVALQHPERVRSLTVHEPVVFQLAQAGPLAHVGAEIREMVEVLSERIHADAPADAARHFIDYWRGAGTWAAFHEKGRREVARVIPKLPVELRAILRSPYRLADYRAIRSPVCLMAGTAGRPAARQVTELLAQAFGEQALHLIPNAGHMAPVTHPQLVNPRVIAHLAANPIPASDTAPTRQLRLAAPRSPANDADDVR